MYLCSNNHEEICFENNIECPFCAMREDLEDEIDDLNDECQTLKDRIDELESDINELRGDV